MMSLVSETALDSYTENDLVFKKKKKSGVYSVINFSIN